MTIARSFIEALQRRGIEQVFAKVKHWMRMAQARTVDAIHDRIANLVAGISSIECASYLRNAGYASS